MFPKELCLGGTVLITGGFGGVGLAMAKWMIEKCGVRHIVLLSRRSISNIETKSSTWQKLSNLFSIAEKYSARIKTSQADVADYDQVNKVIEDINESEFPLRGVIHGALTLHDSLITNMTREIFTTAMRSRVRGAWNLHRSTLEQPHKLHFFILLSSLRNHLIDIGGANYNASNQFFDSLAHFRRNILALPAISISVPAVVGTIYVDKSENDPTSLHRAIKPIPPEILFGLIERFFVEQNSQCKTLTAPIIFAVDWNLLKNEFAYKTTARIQNLLEQQHKQAENGPIQIDIKAASHNILHAKFDDELIGAIAKIFGSATSDRIHKTKPLVEQGMDSLMAVSLRNWLASQHSIFIPVSDISNGMSINDILSKASIKFNNSSKTKDISESSRTDNIETTQAVMTRMEKTSEDSPQSDSTMGDKSYMGTSLIVDLPTAFGGYERNLLFCILDQCPENKEKNLALGRLIASKVKCFSKLCVFMNPPEDKLNQIDLVREYVTQMRRRQPCGNYYLMGYCSGVEIAFRMCSHLTKCKNVNIRSLILVDPLAISTNNVIMREGSSLAPSIERIFIINNDQDQRKNQNDLQANGFAYQNIVKLNMNSIQDTIEKRNKEIIRVLEQIEVLL